MGWIADLLKEIPSAARYKAELEKLESSHESLQAQNRIQKSQLEAKDIEIRNLKEQLTERQTHRLDAMKERLLLFMSAHQYVLVAQVAQHWGIGISVAMHHLENLKADSFVQVGYNAMGEAHWRWSLSPDGRSYLVEHGLIS